MKLKNLFVVVVLLALIGTAGLYSYSYFIAQQNAQIPNVFERNSDVTKSVLVEDGIYMVDLAESIIGWEGSKVLVPGYTDRGTIEVKNGEVEFVDGVLSKAEFTVDMSTITAKTTGSGSGQTGLTRHLMSEDFFDVEKFPTSEFELIEVVPKLEERVYELKGNLTIKEVTKEVVFLAEVFAQDGNTVKAISRIELDRTTFGITYNSGTLFSDLGDKIIDDVFVLELELVAKK